MASRVLARIEHARAREPLDVRVGETETGKDGAAVSLLSELGAGQADGRTHDLSAGKGLARGALHELRARNLGDRQNRARACIPIGERRHGLGARPTSEELPERRPRLRSLIAVDVLMLLE